MEMESLHYLYLHILQLALDGIWDAFQDILGTLQFHVDELFLIINIG